MFLHIDIDSFFASAERSINSSLKGIPMAVGSRSNLEIFDKNRTNIRLINDNSGAFVTPVFYSDKKRRFESYFIDYIYGIRKIRGIITTSSYEARAYGIKTGMPIAKAIELCPNIIIVPSNYPLYHRLSHEIHLFMMKHIPQVEQYSIDEFFCDVSGWVEDKELYDFAQDLQMKILKEYDIPVSIGISKAKWISKLATEYAKPYGIYEVRDIDSFIQDIPIKAFPGIGKGFQKRLHKHYINTLGDLQKSRSLLYSWKKPGIQIYDRVTGIDGDKINHKGDRKSIGISRTFDTIYDEVEIRRRVLIMARHITYMVMAIDVNPTLYYLKIDYGYGVKVKKSLRVDRVFSESLYKSKLIDIYDEISIPANGAIKLTLNVSNFTSQYPKTLSLIDIERDIIECNRSHVLQNLRDRFGLDIIKSGSEL